MENRIQKTGPIWKDLVTEKTLQFSEKRMQAIKLIWKRKVVQTWKPMHDNN